MRNKTEITNYIIDNLKCILKPVKSYSMFIDIKNIKINKTHYNREIYNV